MEKTMKKNYSIYMDETYPIAMSDTVYFLKNVDKMFVALYNGKLEEYFEYFPRMKLMMDALHEWGEKGYVAFNKEEEK